MMEKLLKITEIATWPKSVGSECRTLLRDEYHETTKLKKTGLDNQRIMLSFVAEQTNGVGVNYETVFFNIKNWIRQPTHHVEFCQHRFFVSMIQPKKEMNG